MMLYDAKLSAAFSKRLFEEGFSQAQLISDRSQGKGQNKSYDKRFSLEEGSDFAVSKFELIGRTLAL